MTLRSDTTVEYYFDSANLFYCKHHDTLGVVNKDGDSVQLNNITQENINDFLKNYFDFVLDDQPMVEYFKERLERVEEKEEA